MAKCRTPGGYYNFEVGKLDCMNQRDVKFRVYGIPDHVCIDYKTARKLEKALHDVADKILGEVWNVEK